MHLYIYIYIYICVCVQMVLHRVEFCLFAFNQHLSPRGHMHRTHATRSHTHTHTHTPIDASHMLTTTSAHTLYRHSDKLMMIDPTGVSILIGSLVSVSQTPEPQLLPHGECTRTWDSPEVRLHSP